MLHRNIFLQGDFWGVIRAYFWPHGHSAGYFPALRKRAGGRRRQQFNPQSRDM